MSFNVPLRAGSRMIKYDVHPFKIDKSESDAYLVKPKKLPCCRGNRWLSNRDLREYIYYLQKPSLTEEDRQKALCAIAEDYRADLIDEIIQARVQGKASLADKLEKDLETKLQQLQAAIQDAKRNYLPQNWSK